MNAHAAYARQIADKLTGAASNRLNKFVHRRGKCARRKWCDFARITLSDARAKSRTFCGRLFSFSRKRDFTIAIALAAHAASLTCHQTRMSNPVARNDSSLVPEARYYSSSDRVHSNIFTVNICRIYFYEALLCETRSAATSRARAHVCMRLVVYLIRYCDLSDYFGRCAIRSWK